MCYLKLLSQKKHIYIAFYFSLTIYLQHKQNVMNKIILFFALTILSLIGCSKETEVDFDPTTDTIKTGKIAFSFSAKDRVAEVADKGSKKSLEFENAIPTELIITIKDEEGNEVVSNQRYPLTAFGDSYITENIELPVGNFTLTAFNVANSDNQIILSAPKVGSELAKLVNVALPIEFTIIENETTSAISPEVLEVEEEDNASDFGYVTFSFTVVETQNLFITLDNVETGTSIEGTVTITIDVPNFSSTKELLIGVNKLRIPKASNGGAVFIEAKIDGFDMKTLDLNNDLISVTSLDSPLRIEFGIPSPIGNQILPKISAELFSRGDFIDVPPSTASFSPNNVNLIDIQNFEDSTYVLYNNVNRLNGDLIVFAGATNGRFYSKNSDVFGYFESIIPVGNTFFLAGGGTLFKYEKTTTEGLEFIKYDYNGFNDGLFGAAFEHNGGFYTAQGNELYKSIDLGASLELVTDSLPFLANYNEGENRQIISANGYIYAISNGVIYRSEDDGKSFTEAISLGEEYDSLFLRGDLIVAAGLSGVAISENLEASFFNQRNFDSSYGDFNAYTIVDEEYRIYFEKANVGGPLTTHPDDLEFISFIEFNLKDVVTAPSNQEVYGISDSTIYFNLR